MSIKLNQFFNKTLGVSIVLALVTSLLTPTIANANEPEPPENLDPPTSVTLSVADNTNGTVDITAVIDKPLEDSSSTLSLYKTNDPVTVDTATTGSTVTFNVPKPVNDLYDEYFVTVGAIQSNTVTVNSDTNNWKISLGTVNNVDTFSTTDNAPTITWTVNQNLYNSGKAVYIIKKGTNKIHSHSNSGVTGSWVADRFLKDKSEEYYAVIADHVQSPSNLSQLTNIVTASNSLHIYRKAWEVTLTIDKNTFLTSDPDPVITWTTNQQLIDSIHAFSYYSLYIVDTVTGEILDQIYYAYSLTGTVKARPHIGDTRQYAGYIAFSTWDDPVQNLSQLTEIQAVSPTVSLERTPWTLTATIDQEIFSTDSPTPKISWLTNQPLNRTGGNYSIYFADADTGKIFHRSSGASSGSVTIPRFYESDTKQYIGYIARTIPSHIHVSDISQLTDIQATSNTVSTQTNPWEITIDADKNMFKTNDVLPLITWTANQPLSANNSNAYMVYVFDTTTNKRMGYFTSGATGQSFIAKFTSGEAHEYKAYVAKYKPTNALPATVEALEDVQAVSNSFHISRSPWELSLSIDKTVFTTDDDSPRLTWVANQPINLSGGNYFVYIVNDSTGKIIYTNSTASTAASTGIPRFVSGESQSYTAYVAAGGNKMTDPSYVSPILVTDLKDIQAVSGTVSTSRATWDIVLEVDKTVFSTDDEYPLFVWTTNQSISGSGFHYVTYFIDNSTGQVVFATLLENSHGNISDSRRAGFKSGGPRSYTAYVAKGVDRRDPSDVVPTHVSELEDIQAVSNTITIERAAWNVSLNIERMTHKPDAYFPERPGFTEYVVRWTTNQETGMVFSGVYYDVFVFANDDFLPKPASWNWSGHSLEATFTVPVGTPVNFVAYIAKYKKDTEDKRIELLEDIQAVSNVINEESKSSEALADRFKGGTNPSEGDCNQQCYGDPINTYNGELFENYTDLNIPGVIPFNFSRSYSTTNRNKIGAFGAGWTHNYNMSISTPGSTSLLDADRLEIEQENGSITKFTKITKLGVEAYVAPASTQATLTHDVVTNKLILTRKDNTRFIFNSDTGLLEQIKDLNDNSLTLTYTNNKLTKVTSSENKELLINWSGNKIVNVTDSTQTVTYDYSPAGNLSIVDLPNLIGHKQYVYDTENYITRIIHPNGGFYQNFFDTEGRVVKQINPMSGETLFNYSVKRQTEITLPDGTKNIEQYNAFGQLIKTRYAVGTPEEATYSYEYDFTGQKSKETDPAGNKTTYVHDIFGNIIHVTNAKNATTSFTYNKFNQLVETTNALGHKSTNEYDTKGNLIKTTSFEGITSVTSVNPNGTGNTIQSANDYLAATNKKITFNYDSNGFLSQTTTPEGSTLNVTNNILGNPLTVTDPLGYTTDYVYNAQNQIIETTVANGNTTETEYDNSGYITKTVDKLGNETNYTYDLMGNVLTITTITGTIEYQYDLLQRLIKTIEPNGAVTKYEYDNLGRSIRVTDSLNNEQTTTYTTTSLPATTTDSLGNITSYEYDNVGNTVKITDPLNGVNEATYDLLNRLVSSTSSTGYTETYVYDKDSQLVSSTKVGIETTSYEYDANGNLTTTTYPDSSTEERTYDSDDELLTVKNRDGQISSYQYNAGSQIVKTVRPDLTEVAYAYTNMGELDSTSYDNWATIDTEYEYNLNNQLVSETKNGVETTYAYDAIGQLTSRGPPAGDRLTYDWDQYGQLDKLIYPNGTTLKYVYNIDSTLKQIKQGANVLSEYVYDANGNNTRVNYGNGTYEEKGYDNLNRLTQLEVNNTSNQLYKKELDLNNAGFIIGGKTTVDNTVTENNTYSYTVNQRLENVTDVLTSNVNNYNYDTSSNLLSSKLGTNSFTSNGQLLNSQLAGNIPTSYTHDNRGNRTQKTFGDVTTNYSWSSDNKLTNYVSTNAVNPTANKNISYKYDTNGLLSEKTNNVTNNIKEYTWDTLSSIPTLIEDTTNTYVYGLDSTPFLQVNNTTNEVIYLHGDERNSVVLATDENGVKEWSRSYDEYGSTFTQTPATGTVTPFAYAGEYLDEDTGLYNLRARWYEPGTASFISVDPALNMTGEAYSYASGNPLLFTDPLGLWSMQNTGNSVAGFFDGITGIPIASSIANWIAPGSVNLCSTEYGVANVVGNVASMLLPGLGQAKALATLGGLAYAAGKTGSIFAATIIPIVKATKTTKAPPTAIPKYASPGLTTAQAERRIMTAADNIPKGSKTDGIIYLRTNKQTGQIYVGKAKSDERYLKRQAEHTRKLQKTTGDPNARYRFREIARASGDQLSRAEEYLIRAGGGASVIDNPHHVLENKIYASIDIKYRFNGGDF